MAVTGVRADGSVADVGVLFVHGIGDQDQGATLESFSGPLLKCLRELVSSPLGRDVTLSVARAESGDSLLVALDRQDGDGARRARWILAEAWWAQAFPAPSYGQLVRWLAIVGPQTVYRHALRYLIVPRHRRPVPPLRGLLFHYNLYALIYIRLPLLIWRRVLYPVVMVAVASTLQFLFLLLIPMALIPVLRRGIQRIQYILVASVGDSMAFVAVPDSFEHMVRRVHQEVRRLDSVASRIMVVAHSQGAAVVHEALRRDPSVKVTSFVTLGAGLDKLTALATAAADSTPAPLSRMAPLWGLPLFGALFTVNFTNTPSVVAGTVTVACEVLMVVASVLSLRHFKRLQLAIGERLPLPRQGTSMEWVDIYASADPVPHGPLLSVETEPWRLDPRTASVTSIEVQNRKSVATDHTTYQKNTEQVLVPLIDRICAATPLRLTRALNDYEQMLQRAWTRRQLRTTWLARARLNTLVALWLMVTNPDVRSLLSPLPLTAAMLGLHILTVAVWGWWNRDDMNRFAGWQLPRPTAPLWLFVLLVSTPVLFLSAVAVFTSEDTFALVLSVLFFALMWGIDVPITFTDSLGRWASARSTTARRPWAGGPASGRRGSPARRPGRGAAERP